MSESEFPLPPPTFEFLVFSLKTQAEIQLGMYGLGGEMPEKPNPAAARHAIDLLAMISEKTRGNLSLDEQRLVENTLTELRFRFIQASDKAAQSEAKTEAAPDADSEGASASS